MKSSQLPPVRVEPAVREEIESSLREGESLSQFIESAALQAARARKSQEQFLARGRAALEQALRKGEFYPASDILDGMRSRLQARMESLKRKRAARSS